MYACVYIHMHDVFVCVGVELLWVKAEFGEHYGNLVSDCLDPRPSPSAPSLSSFSGLSAPERTHFPCGYHSPVDTSMHLTLGQGDCPCSHPENMDKGGKRPSPWPHWQ